MGLTLVRFDDKEKAYLAAKGLHGTQFTCFTSTKVQILTQNALEGGEVLNLHALLLALLVQKYKY